MGTSYSLGELPPGLYTLDPAAGNALDELLAALAHAGQGYLVLPHNIADYLIAGTVRREVAFDLENLGLAGSQLSQAVEDIIGSGPFRNREQAPLSLSGGEQQLLAVTAALQQDRSYLLGWYCFDYVSDANLESVIRQLVAHGKRMLEFTHRTSPARWRLAGQRLETSPVLLPDHDWPSWPRALPQWGFKAAGLAKSYPSSNFTLRLHNTVVEQVGCLGILGDNGSGKSTLADCLAGLTAYEGELRVTLPAAPDPKFGYLVQGIDGSLNGLGRSDLIRRFVSHGRMTDNGSEQVERFLLASDAYRLLADLDARVGYRLVVMAALLVGDYDIVILDEPSYGLPAPNVAEFLVQACGALGAKPLVLISHDRNLLAPLCDIIIDLDRGAISE